MFSVRDDNNNTADNADANGISYNDCLNIILIVVIKKLKNNIMILISKMVIIIAIIIIITILTKAIPTIIR